MYVHCVSHWLNPCVAASCRIPVIEDMVSQICAVSDFFCCVLKEMVKSFCPGADQKFANDIWVARCIVRLDVFDKFCELLPAVLTALKLFQKMLIQNIVEATQRKRNRYLWALVNFKLL